MPQNAPPNPFRPDPSPRFILSIPFTTPEIFRAPIVLPLFNSGRQEKTTFSNVPPFISQVPDSLQAEHWQRGHHPIIQHQASLPPKTESNHTVTLDSGSFYLSVGSEARIHDYGERRHSSSSVHSNDIREQLLTNYDEHSDEGRSNSTSHRNKSRQKSPRAETEEPVPHAPHNDAPVMPAANVVSPGDLFYAHPRMKSIRKEGIFHWYGSEGNEPIHAPPIRSGIDIRNPFKDADVVVHEALPKNVVQVWCWDNGSWLPIKPGYTRKIFGKTYVFEFAKDSYVPCWLTRDTIKRRTLAR